MPADERPTGGSTITSRTITSRGERRSRRTLTATPSRRSLLAATVTVPALAVAGCSLRLGQPEEAPGRSGPTPDELARDRAADDADALARAAVLTARSAPAAARRLRTIAEENRAHAAALRAGRPAAATAPSSTADPSPAGSPGSSSTAAPPDAASALRALAARERTAAAAVERDLAGVSGDAARLLASVAASRTVHVAVLGQLAAQERTS